MPISTFDRMLLNEVTVAGDANGAASPPPSAKAAEPKADAKPDTKLDAKADAKAPADAKAADAKPADAKPADAKAAAEATPTSRAEALEKQLRADRALQQKREALAAERSKLEADSKSERDAIAKMRAEVEAEIKEARELKMLAKDDVAEFLKRSGTTYEELTKNLASKKKIPPELREMAEKQAATEKKLAELEAERLALKKADEDRKVEEAKRQEAARLEEKQAKVFAAFGEDVKAGGEELGATAWLMESMPDRARALVTDIAHAMHKETGRLPSNADLAAQVEKSLRTDFSAWLKVPAFATIAKQHLTTMTAPTGDKSQPGHARAGAGAAAGDGPSTLSNDLNATTSAARPTDPLSHEDKVEQLISRMEAERRKAGLDA